MPIIYTYPKVTPAAADLIVISDVSATNPTKATRQCSVGDIVNLVTALVPGGGTTTSVGLSGGTTGITIADTGENPIITAGTFTLGGVLIAANGGTGHASYAIGDILYASGATTLSQLTFASAPIGDGDVLTLAGGVPSWATPTTGTMSSWTLIGDSGSQTITDGNTVDIEGGTDITTAAVATDKVTVTHDDNARTETPVTPAQLAHGATFDAITSVTTTATGHFTADTLTTYRLPAAGAGTVTSVGAINTIGGGITFVTNPTPITGAGTVDLGFSGAIGDILYANSTSSLTKLAADTTSKVLSMQTGIPEWTPLDLVCMQYPPGGSDDDPMLSTHVDGVTVGFCRITGGTNVTVTRNSDNELTIDSTGGGSSSASGTFTPVLVTQGVDGTGTLEIAPNVNYITQIAHYYIQGNQVYIDFYIEFENITPADPTAPWMTDTLGVSAFDVSGTTPSEWVLGLQGIDPLAALLNTHKNSNAGVDITEVTNSLPLVDEGWSKAPQGGKLNKFYGVGSDSDKSVAWFYWLKDAVAPGGPLSTQYSTADVWTSNAVFEGTNGTWVIAGSLNPVTIIT